MINRCPRLKVLDFRKVKQKVGPALQAGRRMFCVWCVMSGCQGRRQVEAVCLVCPWIAVQSSVRQRDWHLPVVHLMVPFAGICLANCNCQRQLHLLEMQERDEAARRFGGADAAAPAANGERTFEPGEGMAEAEAPDDAAEPAPEAVEQPSVRKGPTPEQLTAIKARARLPAVASGSLSEAVHMLC